MHECKHRGRIRKYKNAIIQECGPLALQQTQSINISENRDTVTIVEFQHKAIIRGKDSTLNKAATQSIQK